MKYLLIIGDGMADYPIKELGEKTPLQAADHPNMDRLVRGGICGTVRTIPRGMAANTDVAILTILGYNPKQYCVGRGPLEAASMGLNLRERDVAFRFNLITEENGILKDFTAEHIRTEDAAELVSVLNETLGRTDVRFHPGVSYRHILVLKDRYSDKVHCYPAHDIVGEPIEALWVTPKTPRADNTAKLLNTLIKKSREVLEGHPLNQERRCLGKRLANMIWPWGPGRRPNLPTLRERYGLIGAVISAVDVVNGTGVYTGMDVVRVPGATGFVDTNYEAKADYALKSLKNQAYALPPVEAPDEAGHLGDPKLKMKTIEDLDKRLLGRLLEKIKDDYTIMVLADHLTPIPVRTHTGDPVPFLIYSTTKTKQGGASHFDEYSAKCSFLIIERGYKLLDLFLNYGKG